MTEIFGMALFLILAAVAYHVATDAQENYPGVASTRS